VKIRRHLEKYLVANDDRKKVRQSRNGSSWRAVWFIELVEGKSHPIRLRTYYGTYLTATDVAFLLVMTRCKVLQTVLEKAYDWKYEWEPIRDGFQLKRRT